MHDLGVKDLAAYLKNPKTNHNKVSLYRYGREFMYWGAQMDGSLEKVLDSEYALCEAFMH